MTGASSNPPDESALLMTLRRGDADAFASLVRTHAPRMLAVARRFLKEESDAQDAVQDAFISAYGAIGKFEGHSSLGTWLHTIVSRAALGKLRSQKRRKDGMSVEELLPRFENDGHRLNPEPAWTETSDQSIQTTETRQLVRQHIDQLPEEYRTVLLLRDIEGFDTQQTAQMLELSTAAVKTRLHRARQALRTLLNPHYVRDDL